MCLSELKFYFYLLSVLFFFNYSSLFIIIKFISFLFTIKEKCDIGIFSSIQKKFKLLKVV